MKTSIEGTDGTVGAIYKWVGNKEVGEGDQTIKKIDEMKSVEMDLHFIKPWESHAVGYTNLTDTTDGVKVSWGFDGAMSRPFNILGLFMNMDKAIGTDFEKGLAKLKVLCETEAADGTMRTYEIHETTTEAKTYVGIRQMLSFDQLHNFFMTNFPKIFQDNSKAGYQPTSAPSGLFFTYDEKIMKTDCAAAVVVGGLKGKLGSWDTFEVSGGKTLEVDYNGNYSKIGDAHMAISKYMSQKKYTLVPPVIEEYVINPMTEKDTAKWLTKIFYVVK